MNQQHLYKEKIKQNNKLEYKDIKNIYLKPLPLNTKQPFNIEITLSIRSNPT
jgi:hypothetical protein